MKLFLVFETCVFTGFENFNKTIICFENSKILNKLLFARELFACRLLNRIYSYIALAPLFILIRGWKFMRFRYTYTVKQMHCKAEYVVHAYAPNNSTTHIHTHTHDPAQASTAPTTTNNTLHSYTHIHMRKHTPNECERVNTQRENMFALSASRIGAGVRIRCGKGNTERMNTKNKWTRQFHVNREKGAEHDRHRHVRNGNEMHSTATTIAICMWTLFSKYVIVLLSLSLSFVFSLVAVVVYCLCTVYAFQNIGTGIPRTCTQASEMHAFHPINSHSVRWVGSRRSRYLWVHMWNEHMYMCEFVHECDNKERHDDKIKKKNKQPITTTHTTYICVYR